MSEQNRLTIEQIEHYTKESNYTPPKPIRMLARQLLESIRENEQYRQRFGALVTSEFDKYCAGCGEIVCECNNPNKESGDGTN